MPAIGFDRTFAEGEVLLEADLDSIQSTLTTFFNTTGVDSDNIQTGGITASSKFIDATITTAKLATDSVTTAKILDANVTTAKIDDADVDTTALASSAVTTAKIAASNITTAKIANANVTTAKIAAGAVITGKREGLSVDKGSVVTNSFPATYTPIATTTRLVQANRPQWIVLQARSITNASIKSAGTVRAWPELVVLIGYSTNGVDYSTIYEGLWGYGAGEVGGLAADCPAGMWWTVHVPSVSGTAYYRVSAKGYSSNSTSTSIGGSWSFGITINPLV